MPKLLVSGTTSEVRQIGGGGWLAFRFSGRDESGVSLRSLVGADFGGEASGDGRMTRQGPVFCLGLRLFSSRLLEAEGDARLVFIVRRHFHFHAVADDEANEAFAHFAGDVSEHFVFGTLEFDAEHGASQYLSNGAFQLNRLFFCFLFLYLFWAWAESLWTTRTATTGKSATTAATGT